MTKEQKCVDTEYRLLGVIRNAVVGDIRNMHDFSIADLLGKASQINQFKQTGTD
jgi:hypothetical protein